MKRKVTYPGWLSAALKIALGLLFFGLIYQELSEDATLGERLRSLGARWNSPARYWLLLAVALMPFNIGLESLKWRKLLWGMIPMPALTGLKAVLTGLTVSLFTPNRIGEFAGRILYLPPRHRIAGIFATFMGSLAQYVIYWLGALAALLYSSSTLPFLSNWRWVLILLAVLASVLWLLLYFRATALVHRLKSWKYGNRWLRYLLLSGRYSTTQLRQVLGVAALRYLIFSSQLYALMLFTGFPPDIVKAVTLIPLLFLAQTLVPSFVLTDLGVRGGLALLLFEPWAGSAVLALLPSYLLWGMNIIFPALLGWFSLIQLRLQDVWVGR